MILVDRNLKHKLLEEVQVHKNRINLSKHNKKVNLGMISCGSKLGPFSEESTLILNGI